jgi:hypothetical protein
MTKIKVTEANNLTLNSSHQRRQSEKTSKKGRGGFATPAYFLKGLLQTNLNDKKFNLKIVRQNKVHTFVG